MSNITLAIAHLLVACGIPIARTITAIPFPTIADTIAGNWAGWMREAKRPARLCGKKHHTVKNCAAMVLPLPIALAVNIRGYSNV
jgi:hypothetical protein